jgi:SAM-dependent methyltransferase
VTTEDSETSRILVPSKTGTESTPYDTGFYLEVSSGSLSSARVIAPLVTALVGQRSVVDVGCGIGTWLKAFVELGVEDYLGIDGEYVTHDQLLIVPSRFRSADLKNPPELGRKFDLALCLEVGEHLPAKSAPKLVARLTEASPCVLFSAAMPGQGGTHHVNEQWPNYWQLLFAKHGYERLDPIRPRVWRDLSVEWWYKQNIYLYCHQEVIATNPLLQEEARLAVECPFELLHADILGPLTTLRGLARHLFKAAPRAVGRLLGLSKTVEQRFPKNRHEPDSHR